jgi:hypothetical protein
MQNRHSSQIELMKTELEIEKTQHQEAVQGMKVQLDAGKKCKDVTPSLGKKWCRIHCSVKLQRSRINGALDTYVYVVAYLHQMVCKDVSIQHYVYPCQRFSTGNTLDYNP